MPNSKEILKQRFSCRLKAKTVCSKKSTPGIKWRNVRGVCFLSTAHEDIMVEAIGLRGAHKKEKMIY